MKQHFLKLFRKLVSPSKRYEISILKKKIHWFLDALKFWELVFERNCLRNGSIFTVTYLGREANREVPKVILGLSETNASLSESSRLPEVNLLFSEIPVPGAIRVPFLLSSIVELRKPLDEITYNYHSQLRRELLKNRNLYWHVRIMDDESIERASEEMLVAYAKERHGEAASQISIEEVKRVAKDYGRLDLLYKGNELVGCQLGCQEVRSGKKYWSIIRCGYPSSVFSDSKELRKVNSMNIYMAMEWANKNNYDFFDIGVSAARPGDGLLEWKRRRGGILDIHGNEKNFFIRLPQSAAPTILWHSPLFEIEGKKLNLHLGLPDSRTTKEIISKYRELAYEGLSKVCLHCEVPPSRDVIESLQSMFSQKRSLPTLKIIISPD